MKKLSYDLMRRPVAFHPVLARLFGGVNEALLWQQIYYWSDKGSLEDGWIYKTKEELEEETTLTRKQQDLARKNLEALGVLSVELRKTGDAPTLHYKVYPGVVESLFESKLEHDEPISTKLDYPQRDYSFSTKGTNPLYTESTHTSTTSSRESVGTENDVQDDEYSTVAVDDWGNEYTARWQKRDTSYRKVFEIVGGKNYPKVWDRYSSTKKSALGLIKEHGWEQIEKAMAFYRAHENDPFIPQLSTPIDLDTKWDKLLAYRNKQLK